MRTIKIFSLVLVIVSLLAACKEDQLYDDAVLETSVRVSTTVVSPSIQIDQAYLALASAKLKGFIAGREQFSSDFNPDQSTSTVDLLSDTQEPLRLRIQKGSYDSLSLALQLATDNYNLILRDSVAPEPVEGGGQPDSGGGNEGEGSGPPPPSGGNNGSGNPPPGSGGEGTPPTGNPPPPPGNNSGGGDSGSDDDDDDDDDDGEDDDDKDEGDDDDDESDDEKDKEKDKNNKGKDKDNKVKDKDNKGKDKDNKDKEKNKGKPKGNGKNGGRVISVIDLDSYFRDARPSLLVTGLYQYGTKTLRLVVAMHSVNELVFRNRQATTVNGLYGNQAVASVDVTQWFSSITIADVAGASIINYKDEELLFIHPDYNADLYAKIVNKIPKSLTLQLPTSEANGGN